MSKPLAIDLFCGAGGMSEGIIQAGFHIIFSSDKSQEACQTYQYRHEQLGLYNGENTFLHIGDISNLTGEFIFNSIKNLELFKKNLEKIDVIFGGPPCQGFSRAGKRDKNDSRNLLFKEYLRIISEINPNYVVMENVVGLLDTKLDNFISYDGENYLENVYVTKILENEFSKIGYIIKKYNSTPEINFKKLVLDASEFGVPQKRERLVIVAYKKNMREPNNIDKYKVIKKVTVEEAISDLISNRNIRNKQLEKLKKEGKLSYIEESKLGRTCSLINNEPIKREEIKNIELSNHLDYIIERFSLYKEGESSKDVKERLLKNGITSFKKIENLITYTYEQLKEKNNYNSIEEFKEKVKKILKLEKSEKKEIIDILLSKKNIRSRLNRNKISRTMVTLPDDYISPFENRVFSVREMARIQSFDDSFIFLGKRTTGGNRRKLEVPQYTQVGNAVPPLLAKAVAMSIKDVIE